MRVRRDTLGLALGHVHQAPQEAPGGVLIAVLAAHGVEEVAIAVDDAGERAPAARATFTSVSSMDQETPAQPRRLARSRSAQSGARRNSQLRIVSCVTA